MLLQTLFHLLLIFLSPVYSQMDNLSSNDTQNSTQKTSTTPHTILATSEFASSSNILFCSCDTQKNACSINCCCDPDCGDKHRKIFTFCEDEEILRRKLEIESRLKCAKTDVLYRNNMPFVTETSKKGFFCLLSENLQERPEYKVPNEKIITKFGGENDEYFWNVLDNGQALTSVTNKHAYKTPLIFYKITDKIPTPTYLRLPISLYSEKCDGHEPIKYLLNFYSKCVQKFSSFPSNCEENPLLSINYFLENIFFSPLTKTEKNETNFSKLAYFECENDLQKCSKTQQILRPTYNKKSLTCENALESLSFKFYHEGILGITQAFAYFSYKNLTVDKILEQKFKARFSWAGEEEVEDAQNNLEQNLKVGYSIGMGIKIGFKGNELEKAQIAAQKDIESSNLKEEEKLKKIEILKEKKILMSPKNIEFLSVTNNGNCESEERTKIGFGYDVFTECFLDVRKFNDCGEAQDRIVDLLLGFSSSLNFSERYMAAVGSPNLTNIADWIQIKKINFPPIPTLDKSNKVQVTECNSLISSLEIRIIYTHIGPIFYPVKKIIEAQYKFGTGINISLNLSNGKLKLRTKIKFRDLTPSLVSYIPEWPVISIKLPSDFFYPFSMSSSGKIIGVGSFGNIFFIVTCVAYFI